MGRLLPTLTVSVQNPDVQAGVLAAVGQTLAGWLWGTDLSFLGGSAVISGAAAYYISKGSALQECAQEQENIQNLDPDVLDSLVPTEPATGSPEHAEWAELQDDVEKLKQEIPKEGDADYVEPAKIREIRKEGWNLQFFPPAMFFVILIWYRRKRKKRGE